MEQEKEVVLEGTIWKEILTPGLSRISLKPTEGSTCVMRIENVTCDETLEESYDLMKDLRAQSTTILTGEPEKRLVIGEADCELDKHIEMAIQLMKDGERSRITIFLQDLVSGQKTRKISFEATLMKHEKFKPIWEWTPQEKYEIAMRYKNMGVSLFKESEFGEPRYKDAFHRFSRACKILITLEPIGDLELDAELLSNIQNLRIKLYNNMAACQGKHNNYYHVIELCSKVLSRDDKNVLTLFRRGYAYGQLKDYERAVEDFTKLLTIEPNNKEALLKVQEYRWFLRRAKIHCNEMVKRMFK
ncbi:peptidyl-prolyl cis-trans isomerase FKBP4 [Venturia canescens]|uniref:peptidyl-prolyl cis-trans isomerase FKBP4 n=1 Tax=Venturia canescens TaxID=32260 RepID=UPI001C9C5034|nr:peptidyl-prolyl cis-trans isomerase FKBP4-like [Venturia canescens]